jgi:hypothetical protein
MDAGNAKANTPQDFAGRSGSVCAGPGYEFIAARHSELVARVTLEAVPGGGARSRPGAVSAAD